MVAWPLAQLWNRLSHYVRCFLLGLMEPEILRVGN